MKVPLEKCVQLLSKKGECKFCQRSVCNYYLIKVSVNYVREVCSINVRNVSVNSVREVCSIIV